MAVIKLKRSKLSEMLVNKHTHAELANNENSDQIVYREKDIVELLLEIKSNKGLLDDFDLDKNSN